MKKNLFYVMSLAGLFALSGCSQEELADVQQEEGVKLGIKSIGAAIQSRATTGTGPIEGYLPQGAKVGLFFVENGKTSYNENNYHNIECTQATVNGATQSWTIAEDILIDDPDGFAYLYYPYNDGDEVNINAVPVDCSDGKTDFMYGYDMAYVGHTNITPTMQHLCAWLRFTIKRGVYDGDCLLKSICISDGLAGTVGTYDLVEEKFTKGEDDSILELEFIFNKNIKYGEDLICDVLVIPSEDSFPYVYMWVDNMDTNGKRLTHKWKSGFKYEYTITMSENIEVEYDLVSVSEYSTGETDSWTDKPYGQE